MVYRPLAGNILGVTLDVVRVVAMFRKVRRAGLISEFVSISPNHKHRLIHIACDGGRVCRSYFVASLLSAFIFIIAIISIISCLTSLAG